MSEINSINKIKYLAENLKVGQVWDKHWYKERMLTYKYLNPRANNRVHDEFNFTNLSAYTDEQKEMTEAALNEIAEKTGLEFRMAQQGEMPDLSFGNYDQSDAIGGFSAYPGDINPGRIWTNFAKIDEFSRIIRHEIGHALGLQHAPDVTDPNSIMSGNHNSAEFQPADILALQDLYGGDPQRQTDDGHRVRRHTDTMHCGTEHYIAPESYQKKLTLMGENNQPCISFAVDEQNKMLRIHFNKKFKHGNYNTFIKIFNKEGGTVFKKFINKRPIKYLYYDMPFTEGYRLEIIEFSPQAEMRLQALDEVSGITERLNEENNFLMTKTGLERQAETYRINRQAVAETHIDALADGLKSGFKWDTEPHQQRILRYKYPIPQYEATTPQYGYTHLTGYTDAQRAATTSVLNEIAQKIGLEFILVADDQEADISFINYNSQGESSEVGFTDYLPDPQTSTVWTDTFNTADSDNFKSVISHQIGHALGLQHPSYHLGQDSIMSHPQNRTAFKPVDILALQQLYGADPQIEKRAEPGIENLIQEMSAFVSSDLAQAPLPQDHADPQHKMVRLTKPA